MIKRINKLINSIPIKQIEEVDKLIYILELHLPGAEIKERFKNCKTNREVMALLTKEEIEYLLLLEDIE